MNDWRIDMGKFGALAILLAVAAVIYLLNPGSQVQVVKEQPAMEATQPDVVTNEQATKVDTENSKTQLIDSAKPHSDHEDHDTNNTTEIPQYIKDSLQAKRIPASELTVEQHADGSSSIDFKGQYQHVPVAVIDENGKVKIIETRIDPIANQ